MSGAASGAGGPSSLRPEGVLRSTQVTPVNVDIAKVAPTYHLYSTQEKEAVIARLT